MAFILHFAAEELCYSPESRKSASLSNSEITFADNKSLLKPQRCILSFNSSKIHQKLQLHRGFFFAQQWGQTCWSIVSQRSDAWKRPNFAHFQVKCVTALSKSPNKPLPFVSTDYCTRGKHRRNLVFQTQEREMWDKALRGIKAGWLMRNKNGT